MFTPWGSSIAVAGRPWAFDADPEAFRLAVEAWRINVAHLFDPMMAVHTSNVEALPHQITAVYSPEQPRGSGVTSQCKNLGVGNRAYYLKCDTLGSLERFALWYDSV